MTCRIVFFDIDGTLLNTGGAGQKAMERALAEEFGMSAPFENVLTAGRTDRGISDEIFARHALPDHPENRLRFRDAYLQRLPDTLNALPGLLLPGVPELLAALSALDDVRLGLLTGNYADGAWIKLRHFQLASYFEFGGFGDDHAHRNDVAAVARKAAAVTLSADVAMSSAVVGDTPADIECAHAIQARSVAVATGVYGREELRPHNPHVLVDDFSDTPAVVAQILGS